MKNRSMFTQLLSSPHGLRWTAAGALTAAFALLLSTAGSAAPGLAADRLLGSRISLGRGEVTSFAQLTETGAPRSIGIMISADALASLPAESSDQHRCFDRDG